jgi:hypothetical protein
MRKIRVCSWIINVHKPPKSTHEMVTMGTCAVCKSNSNRDTGGKWMTGGRAHLAASPTEDSGANIPLAHEAPEPAR